MEYLDLTGCNCIVIILLLFHPMLSISEWFFGSVCVSVCCPI